ncbi:hypothetical protein [Spirulina sp. 06S082]|uniref:hypothetical protein n=1 Tax=Spirulina sp. 06S082 TaxID=3110248 RepID=UPI002B2174A1|nr:hypothetical protein [Spirulina sp. 06S082]
MRQNNPHTEIRVWVQPLVILFATSLSEEFENNTENWSKNWLNKLSDRVQSFLGRDRHSPCNTPR